MCRNALSLHDDTVLCPEMHRAVHLHIWLHMLCSEMPKDVHLRKLAACLHNDTVLCPELHRAVHLHIWLHICPIDQKLIAGSVSRHAACCI